MLATTLLKDAFGRVAAEFAPSLNGLTAEELLWRPGPDSNSIGWLAWHIARCEDAQMSPLRARLDEANAADAAALVSSASMLDPLGATGVAGTMAGPLEEAAREAADTTEVWTSEGWFERFGLPYERGDIGYGHSGEHVGAFDVTDAGLLIGYYDQVHGATLGILDRMNDDGLDRIVDTQWDPPVTVGVRVVSVVNDITAHIGQIGYIRGLLTSLR